jgi:hypothetical protein
VQTTSDATYTSTDLTIELAARYGLRASRDRIARMADVLFGREDEDRRHRRFSEDQIPGLALALSLVEAGLSRQEASDMLQNPAAAHAFLQDHRRHRRRLEEQLDRALAAMPIERMSA